MKCKFVFAMGLIAAGLGAGCGGGGTTAVTTVPTAHLEVSLGAATTETGRPLTVTVTARDASNAVVPTYVGTVRITTSDPRAALPPDATLPRGTGKFTVTFGTAGSHTITASDTAGNAVAATSGGVTVSLGAGPVAGHVGVNPTSLILPAGGVQQFDGAASGAGTLTWSVEEGAAGGSITATGLYTAPATPGTYHVTLTASNTSDTGRGVVTVTDAGISTTATGTMHSAHGAYTATLLAAGPAATNGKVLIAGGNSVIPPDGVPVRGVSSAELYDPSTGSFAMTGAMIAPRYAHSATLLPNGRVLVVGGLGDGGEPGMGGAVPPVWGSAEVYDPATGTFTKTGSMLVPRASHTATLISGGRVLIVGGIQEMAGPFAIGLYPYYGSVGLVTAELYDVATGKFTATGSMSTARFGHTATLLADGTVLVTGGEVNSDWLAGEGRFTSAAEIYDPASGTFTPVGSMSLPRNLHAATLLGDGKVLVTGGTWHTAPAELYDPNARTFSNTGTMRSVRSAHAATALANGSILVAGGALEGECIADGPSWCQPVSSLEIFDPTTGTFAVAGFMSAARLAHTATLLDSGKLLLAGGEGELTAELYP